MSLKLNTPREPGSAYSHLVGVILSIFGTGIIIVLCLLNPVDLVKAVACVLFSLSLVALYSSSTIYHWCNAGADKIKALRRLDHAMIYVLIAGSYTPILLCLTPISESLIFTGLIWAVAFFGILIKLLWFDAPRWLSTSLYILMGWSILLKPSALTVLESGGITLLVLGGVSYTIGGVIYAIKKPVISAKFGFHELFHVFVLLGSLFHYLCVVFYVL